MTNIQEILLGGFLASVGGVVAIAAEKIWEAKKDDKQRKLEDSALAFSAVVKMIEIAAWFAKIKRAVDESFAEAEAMGAGALDIGVKVKPLLGIGPVAEKFSSAELALLLSTGDQGLLEKVLQLQGNFSAEYETIAHFNQIRASYSDFLREHAQQGEFVNGEYAVLQLDAAMRHRVEPLIVELNQVIGSVIESMDDDLAMSRDIVMRAQTALRSVDGINVPAVHFIEGA